ncbi:MAG: T9SS type A sorting domain-containing protein [Chitinophagales bacterium]|nr:T9SS type A sorting domain-containing protein [Chitinophagales bacterium]
MFPNPTSTDFRTQTIPVGTQFFVTDLFGRKVEYFTSTGDQITFGSMYPSGVYLTRLKYADGTSKIYKLIKTGK